MVVLFLITSRKFNLHIKKIKMTSEGETSECKQFEEIKIIKEEDVDIGEVEVKEELNLNEDNDDRKGEFLLSDGTPELKCNYSKSHDPSLSTVKKKYQCDICMNVLPSQKGLTFHKRVHSNNKQHKCNICQATFAQKANLKNHLRLHSGGFSCKPCEKQFQSYNDFVEHLDTSHKSQPPIKCPICGTGFWRNFIYERHLKEHSSEKPFKCNICEDTFIKKWHFKRHVAMHAGEKQTKKCVFCGERYTSKKLFEAHMSTHSAINNS